MANFKRHRPRTDPSKGYSGKAILRRLGIPDADEDYGWINRYPRYWDKQRHIRPARRRARALEGKILKGTDPDQVVWPLSHKPHTYYW